MLSLYGQGVADEDSEKGDSDGHDAEVDIARGNP
jgi:hypothetical protein